MANLAEKSKTELAKTAQAAMARLKNIRESSKKEAERGVGALLAVGGAYGVGKLRKRYGDLNIPGTSIDADLVGGVTALAIGFVADSDALLQLGVGVTSGYVAIAAYEGKF